MDTIDISLDQRGVATLTLSRADKHNALSAEMMDALTDAVGRLGADGRVRAVILAAQGASFCAGGDLGWMRSQMDAAPEDRAREARRLANMLRALDEMPKPLIGRVHGNAFGGGVGMACVCDVVIAADTVKMGLTETRLGLIPATIGPYVVARMGEARARQVFMSARIFDAVEAERLGIVTRVVPEAMLDDAVQAEVAPYLSCAPGAVAQAKALVRTLSGGIKSPEMVDASIAALVERWESDEAVEGIAAFFEKRKAVWVQND